MSSNISNAEAIEVSIVLAVFNGERTLSNTINSVLRQTFRNFELLIWNDGSTDATAAIISKFSDPRVVLLGSSWNIGPGPARDSAIKIARGRYLAFIDADDHWLPERLERLLELIHVSPDTMVFDDLMLCHDSDHGMVPWKRLRGRRAFSCDGVHPAVVDLKDYLQADRLLIKPIIPKAWVQKTGASHGEGRFGEDARFFLNLLTGGIQLKYHPHAMYLYRITPGSLTSAKDRDIQMRQVLLEFRSRFLSASPEGRALDKKLSQLQRSAKYIEILQLLKAGKNREGADLVISNPWFFTMFFKKAVQDICANIHSSFHVITVGWRK